MREASQRERGGWKRLCGRCGTCLGVLYEFDGRTGGQRRNTAYIGVNGMRDGCRKHQLGWYRRVFGPFMRTKTRRFVRLKVNAGRLFP